MDNTRYKVILVDDNQATLNQGKSILQSLYTVYTFQSAVTLFENIGQVMPDIILLDVEMPEMDGFETIKKLKADIRYKDIPVLFLTSRTDEESEKQGFLLGAADYITKPFSGPLLLKRISNQILHNNVQNAVKVYLKNIELVTDEVIKEKNKADLAEMANRAKTQFLASMSHEIRTPINSIMGFAELAIDTNGEGSELRIKDYLKKILENTKWLLSIVNDILDISKIESGKMELEHNPFDLNNVFLQCKSAIIPEAKKKGLDFLVNLEPPAEKMLIGDSHKLFQALINLLGNAVKFTETGTIKFSSMVKKRSENKATVYFEVKDTGIGMNPEQIENILKPFIQAESGATRKYGGTGLGLPIVKNIVELMGGTLSVKSSPGEGSEFSFEVDFDTVNFSDYANDKNFDMADKPEFTGTILVCDDSIMNQEVICDHLARVGFKTVVANNGKEGVEEVRRRKEKGEAPFDLIFMDIFMPVMDGIEAAAQINEIFRKDGQNKIPQTPPIIAVTANVIESELEKYRKNGMTDVLGKPFTARELWDMLLKNLTPVSAPKDSAPFKNPENY